MRGQHVAIGIQNSVYMLCWYGSLGTINAKITLIKHYAVEVTPSDTTYLRFNCDENIKYCQLNFISH